jgi:hypothetical protein
MQNAVMTVVLTVRDVPDDIRDLLVRQARERGQSLQALLLSVLSRQADFSRNQQILVEISEDFHRGNGATEEAPDAAELLACARSERGLPVDPASDRAGSNVA